LKYKVLVIALKYCKTQTSGRHRPLLPAPEEGWGFFGPCWGPKPSTKVLLTLKFPSW